MYLKNIGVSKLQTASKITIQKVVGGTEEADTRERNKGSEVIVYPA